MRRLSCFAVLFLFASACTSGGTSGADSATPDKPDKPDPSKVDAPVSECPAATDGCMNEDNAAECRARAKECPGKVLTLKSCPLQFSCS